MTPTTRARKPCKYAARLRNARRIGWVLKKALAEGCILTDEHGDRVHRIIFRGFCGAVGLSTADPVGHVGNKCFVVYMHSERDTANGMEMTPRQFTAMFKDWSIVRPANIERIRV